MFWARVPVMAGASKELDPCVSGQSRYYRGLIVGVLYGIILWREQGKDPVNWGWVVRVLMPISVTNPIPLTFPFTKRFC